MPATPDAPPLTRADLDAAVRLAVREEVARALRAERDWLRDLVQEALENAAHDEARRESEHRAAMADPRRGYAAAEGHA